MATVLGDGNLLTARLNFQVEGSLERAMNVLHYEVDSVVGAPANVYLGLANIADAVFEHFADTWAATASEDVTFNSVTVTNVFPAPRSVSVFSTGGIPAAGSQVSDGLPLQDAPTILKRTDIGARWGLGRMFVVGTPETAQNNGVIAAPQITLLNSLADKVAADIAVTGVGFSCTLRPVLLRGPEDNPVSLTPIRRAELSDTVIKTQRRRRPGKGS